MNVNANIQGGRNSQAIVSANTIQRWAATNGYTLTPSGSLPRVVGSLIRAALPQTDYFSAYVQSYAGTNAFTIVELNALNTTIRNLINATI